MESFGRIVLDEFVDHVADMTFPKEDEVIQAFVLDCLYGRAVVSVVTAYYYRNVMTILHAQVRNGRVVVDEPMDLPDGANVELLVLDAAGDMDESERTALEASIGRGLAEADRGQLHSVDDVLARLRRI